MSASKIAGCSLLLGAASAASLLLCVAAPASARVCGDMGASKPMSAPVNYAIGAQDEPIYQGSYALLIGSANYQDSATWPALGTIPVETADLARLLVDQGFQVRILCDATASELGDVQGFLDAFAKPDNRVVIFMSGHGWVDSPSPIGYFAGTDSPPPGPAARAKGLGSEQVITLATSSHAKHLMIIVDACYSAAIFTRKSAVWSAPATTTGSFSEVDFEDLSQQARQFITAGNESQQTTSPSIFSPALVLGLAGYADPGSHGFVRASQLGVWLRQVVANSTGQGTTPRWGYVPLTPGQIVTGGGDMLFHYDPRRMDTVRATMQSPGLRYLSLAAPPFVAPQPGPGPAQGAQSAWPDRRYQIIYYEKTGDHGRVIDALDKAAVPYAATRTILPDEGVTNGLACHPDTPVEVVRAAARALIANGVPIRVIDRVTKHVEQRRYLVEALQFKRVDTPAFRDLTLADLSELSGCSSNFVRRSGGTN